ncbi:MAG: glycosyltransferase family 2 protein [Halobacteriaceae archaeon]
MTERGAAWSRRPSDVPSAVRTAEAVDATDADGPPGRAADSDAVGDAPTGGLVPRDSETPPVVSLVLPTKNEAAGVGECIRRAKAVFAQAGVPGEIIVSDSSTDRTPAIATELGAHVVHPDRPGYGYAYRYAFEHVRGEYVAMGDADTTYDFSELPKLLEPVVTGQADVVLGSRFAGTISPGSMPALHRIVGNPLLTATLNRLYGVGVSDAHSGFRVCKRSVLEDLHLESDGMEFASEMLLRAAARDLRISEVPITYHRRLGEAKLHSLRDGWRHLRFMLVNAPTVLFGVPGAAVGLALLALGLAGVSPGLVVHATGSLLTVVGAQVALMGALCTAAGDPIRPARDPVSRAFVAHFSLERGLVVGAVALWCLGLYALARGPLSAGPHADVAALTAGTLGLQAVFASFFASSLVDGRFRGGR